MEHCWNYAICPEGCRISGGWNGILQFVWFGFQRMQELSCMQAKGKDKGKMLLERWFNSCNWKDSWCGLPFDRLTNILRPAYKRIQGIDWEIDILHNVLWWWFKLFHRKGQCGNILHHERPVGVLWTGNEGQPFNNWISLLVFTWWNSNLSGLRYNSGQWLF